MEIDEKFTFIIEAIYPIDRRAFMIATKEEEIFRIFHFVCEQQTNCLQRLLSS